ncbi:MAG: hypothetical protein ACI8QS_000475 [Planctomycetota bacterium]|jgi:hypothetical protein
MSNTKDPFYVGYLPLPGAFHSIVRAFIVAGALGAIAMAFFIAPGQQDPGVGQWDTSTTFTIEGHLSVNPYPVVYVDDPESAFGSRAVLLVSSLKFGATKETAAFDGKRVRARGNFITRQGRGMFELSGAEDAVVVISEGSTEPRVESLGEHELIGEITDSKCFLGVMKPGFGKTHRACAVRCISGGIPPIFTTRDDSGEATFYLLTGPDHSAVNEAVLPFVSEPVELRGQLERHGDLLVYVIDPADIERK